MALTVLSEAEHSTPLRPRVQGYRKQVVGGEHRRRILFAYQCEVRFSSSYVDVTVGELISRQSTADIGDAVPAALLKI